MCILTKLSSEAAAEIAAFPTQRIEVAARRLSRDTRTGGKLKARWRLLVESWSLSFS